MYLVVRQASQNGVKMMMMTVLPLNRSLLTVSLQATQLMILR
jgi:hypothetical protein